MDGLIDTLEAEATEEKEGRKAALLLAAVFVVSWILTQTLTDQSPVIPLPPSERLAGNLRVLKAICLTIKWAAVNPREGWSLHLLVCSPFVSTYLIDLISLQIELTAPTNAVKRALATALEFSLSSHLCREHSDWEGGMEVDLFCMFETIGAVNEIHEGQCSVILCLKEKDLSSFMHRSAWLTFISALAERVRAALLIEGFAAEDSPQRAKKGKDRAIGDIL